MTDSLDIQQLLALSGLSGQEAWDDDDGDLIEMDYDDDDETWSDDEFADFDDDDDDEDYDDPYSADFSDDEDDEGFEERRRRRRRRTRRSFSRPRYRRTTRRRPIRKVRGSRGTTLRTSKGRALKVRFGRSYATSVEVNKLIKDTERKFADAVKERKANYDRLTKQISRATSNLDGKVNAVRKTVKRVEDQAKTTALLGLLQKEPTIKSIRFSETPSANEDLAATVEFEKKSNNLGLLLAMGGLSGSGGGNGGIDPAMMLVLASGNL